MAVFNANMHVVLFIRFTKCYIGNHIRIRTKKRIEMAPGICDMYNCIMKYGLGIGIETGPDGNQVFNFKPIEDAIFSETLF